MPLSAEQRTNRARNAAYARHHPGSDPADLERERIDRHMAAIIDAGRKGKLTPEQTATLQRAVRYGPAESSETG